MSKFPLLLLLAGLALGLWLGFNPAAHRQVVRAWDRAITGQAFEPLQPLINFRRLNRQASRWFGSRDEVAPTVQPQSPRLVTWGEVTSAFQAFWGALYQIFLQVVMKLRAVMRH